MVYDYCEWEDECENKGTEECLDCERNFDNRDIQNYFKKKVEV